MALAARFVAVSSAESYLVHDRTDLRYTFFFLEVNVSRIDYVYIGRIRR